VVRFMPLLRRRCARVAAAAGEDPEELLAEALAVYVIPNARKYRTGRNMTLVSWVRYLCWNGPAYATKTLAPAGTTNDVEVLISQRVAPENRAKQARSRINSIRMRQSMHDPVNSETGLTYEETLSGETHDPIDAIDAKRCLQRLWEAANEDQQTVLRVLAAGESQRRAGEAIGVTGTTVQNYLKRLRLAADA